MVNENYIQLVADAIQAPIEEVEAHISLVS